MIATPITTPAWRYEPKGFQYLRRTMDGIQLVYEAGLLNVECSQPLFIVRDLLLGGVTQLEPGIRDGGTMFENEINSTAFSNDCKIGPASGVIAADNFPPKEGCFIIESETWAAYYPFDSLQIIGLKGSCIYIITRAQVYRADFNDNVSSIVFQHLCGFATTLNSFHLTQLPAEEFWNSSFSRLFTVDIAEVKGVPDTVGGMDAVLDLRKPSDRAVSSLMPSQRVSRPAPDTSFEM